MYCVKTSNHNTLYLKFFSPFGGHTILVITYQTLWKYSDRDPDNWGKNRDFQPVSGFEIDEW